MRFRLVIGRQVRGPWRATKDEVMRDAIKAKLAPWDDEAREHFLSAPVDCQTDAMGEVGDAD